MKNNKNQPSTINHQPLTIGWLYPELMNIYGDRGNIITLTKRCEWRGIKTQVKYLNPGFSDTELKTCDLLIMGGAQDRQQTIVNDDLKKHKNILSEMIGSETPGLFICGGFQFLGKYYKEANGEIIDGLGIFDLYTESPDPKYPRLIGNIAIETKINDLGLMINESDKNHKSSSVNRKSIVVGFENHGGRTYLGKNIKPFGKVLKGYGNNGTDQTEGAVFKNSYGTYMHGPILPKNPVLADKLIRLALSNKYENIKLVDLDDKLENQAKEEILKRIII